MDSTTIVGYFVLALIVIASITLFVFVMVYLFKEKDDDHNERKQKIIQFVREKKCNHKQNNCKCARTIDSDAKSDGTQPSRQFNSKAMNIQSQTYYS